MIPANGTHALPDTSLMQCHILVLDDDPYCVEEYAETIHALGYPCAKAFDAISALRMIAEDPRIGIVVTDLQMPMMDGISFLDELSSRFPPTRPLVALVITGFGSMDTAVQAMRLNATDFLSKPVSREDFAAALRRASRRWAQQVGQLRLSAMGMVPAADQASQQAAASPLIGERKEPAELGPGELLPFVRSIVKSRQRRADFLDSELFSDPTWDILLDLTAAKIEGKPVPVSSACAAAEVPLSTALRHVRHLVDSGLVRRWKDEVDKRRDLLELEDETMAAMTRYLISIRNSMQSRQG